MRKCPRTARTVGGRPDLLRRSDMAQGMCSVAGCGRVAQARGWCKMHWARWKRNGAPGEGEVRRIPTGDPCLIEGCVALSYKRGWCNLHYIRWRRTGTPMGTLRRSIEDRFWANVDKNGPVSIYRPDLGPCWLWTGATDPNGYGRFKLGARGTRTVLAHRWAYEYGHGSIADGLELDHLCRVHACVLHTEPVTHLENLRRDREARGICQT